MFVAGVSLLWQRHSLGFIILSKYFFLFSHFPLPKKLLTLLCTSKKQSAVIAAHLISLVRFPALIRIRSQFRRQVSNRELAARLRNPSLIPDEPRRKLDPVKTLEHRFFPALSSPTQNHDGNDTGGTENPQKPAEQPRVQRDGSRCSFA